MLEEAAARAQAAAVEADDDAAHGPVRVWGCAASVWVGFACQCGWVSCLNPIP